jgi:hypothetical protein
MDRLMALLVFLAFMLSLPAPVSAYLLTVNYDPGATQTISGIDQSCTGSAMAGMEVKATWESGAGFLNEPTRVWQATGTESGGVTEISTFLSGMSQAGDTLDKCWSVTHNGNLSHVIKITIDAFKGNTVFDTSFGGQEGTPGSGPGKTFAIMSYVCEGDAGQQPIIATYRDLVAVGGNAPVGDLYRYLDICFPDSEGFRGQVASMEFIADTDRAVVPFPPAALLLGSVLLPLFYVRRKKRG